MSFVTLAQIPQLIQRPRQWLPTLPKTWRPAKQGCYIYHYRHAQVSLSGFLLPQIAYTTMYTLYQQNSFQIQCRLSPQKNSYEVLNLVFLGSKADSPHQSQSVSDLQCIVSKIFFTFLCLLENNVQVFEISQNLILTDW